LEQIKGEYKIAGRRDSITAEQGKELDKIYGDKPLYRTKNETESAL
jgi:hypothetical protein